MTAETQMWGKLAEPFPDAEVKQRPGAAKYDHKQSCEGPRCRVSKDPNAHHQFSYVDARAVMQRLDDVVTPAGWEFTSSVIPGTDIVHGRLTVAGFVREDYGYPNSDKDEEPIKAASSDALKRCAVMFGIGRHLYDDNKPQTRQNAPQRPAPQRPAPKELPPHSEPYDGTWSQSVTYDIPEEPEDLFPPIGQPQNAVPTNHCPIHDVPWAGGPGDYWHKDPDGKYCRHPDNIKRSARRAS
jgi:hypothetical protein